MWSPIEDSVLSVLPAHITLSLIFSYIVWSKFLKNGGLRLENIKDVMDILSIFVMLFFFINSSYIIISIFSYRNDVLYAFSTVPQVVTFTYIYLLASLYIILIPARDMELNRNSLNRICLIISMFFVVMIFFTLSFMLGVVKNQLEDIFLGRIFTLYRYGLIVPIIYFCLNLFTFFRDSNKQKSNYNFDIQSLIDTINSVFSERKNLISFVLAISISAIAGFSLPYFMIPSVATVENPPSYYELKGQSYNGLADEVVTREYYVTDEGIGFELISLKYEDLEIGKNPNFKINYSYLGKNNRAYLNNKKTISINDGRPSGSYEKFGITDFRIQNQTNSIIIRIDKNKLNLANVSNFILKGKRERNISDYFFIKAPPYKSCSEKICTLNFSFENNLNYRITGEDISFISGANMYNGKDCNIISAGRLLTNDKSYEIVFEELPQENNRTIFRFGGLRGDFQMMVRDTGLKSLDVESFSIGPNTSASINITQKCKT